jgi:hypothetical protein
MHHFLEEYIHITWGIGNPPGQNTVLRKKCELTYTDRIGLSDELACCAETGYIHCKVILNGDDDIYVESWQGGLTPRGVLLKLASVVRGQLATARHQVNLFGAQEPKIRRLRGFNFRFLKSHLFLLFALILDEGNGKISAGLFIDNGKPSVLLTISCPPSLTGRLEGSKGWHAMSSV